MKHYTCKECKEMDRISTEEYGVPSIVLMENAGRGIAQYILSQKPSGLIIICSGKGHNGGDGLVIARHLDNHQIPVQVLLFANPKLLQGDEKTNYDIVIKSHIPLTVIDNKNIYTLNNYLNQAEWVIDALLGTGLKGHIKPPYDAVIEAIHSAQKKVLAVDIPSGLDGDTGEPLGHAVRATVTLTMLGLKQGFSNPKAKQYTGMVKVVDIGLPRILLEHPII